MSNQTPSSPLAASAPLRTNQGPILTATDFSKNGDLAVHRAARLATELKVDLELLTVVSRSRLEQIRAFLSGQGDAVESRVLTHAQERLLALREELVRTHGGSIRCQVRSGSAHQEILRHVSETGASLLVVGAQGERGFARGILGGTASKLLRDAALPVLVVRRPADRPYRVVLIATDFSDSCRGALSAAGRVAPSAWFEVLHVVDPPFEMKLVSSGVPSEVVAEYKQSYAAQARRMLGEYLRAEAAGSDPSVSSQLVPGQPATVILQQAITQHADLIVVGKSGQSIFTELLFNSVSAEVREEARIDVLILHGSGQAPS